MLNMKKVVAKRNGQGIKALLAVFLVGALSACAVGFPVTVRDDRGNEIEIARRPERVVVLAALYGEIVVSLGARDQVIGVADSPDMPEAFVGTPTVGPSFSPSVEAIIGLEPDLVMGAWGDVRSGLENVGIPVLTAGQPGGFIAGIPDIFAAIQAVGEALGRPAQAAQLMGDIAVQIVKTESAVLGRAPRRAAFLYMEAPGTSPYAIGRRAVEHELLLRAGATNVFDDVEGFPQVSLEEVLARDPEVIFTDPTQVQHVLDSEQLQGVTAVRENQVFGVRAAEVTSTRVAESLVMLARKLHPEAFAED